MNAGQVEMNNFRAKIKLASKFSRAELINLLLICALPVHLWAIITLLHDFSWYLEERTFNYFLAVAGYSLGFAILESLIFFVFIYLLTFLFPRSWKGDARLAVAGTLALVIAFWAILNQAVLLFAYDAPPWFEWVMLRVYFRQHQLSPVFWIILLASAGFPVVFLPRWEKGQKGVVAVLEKLSILVPIYLVFDLVGIIAAIYRVITYWV